MELSEGSTECVGYRGRDLEVEREPVLAVLVLPVAGAELHVHGASTAHVDLDSHIIASWSCQRLAGVEPGLCQDGCSYVRELLSGLGHGECETVVTRFRAGCDLEVRDLEMKVPIAPNSHLGFGVLLAGSREAQRLLVDHVTLAPFLEYGLDRISTAEVVVHH